MKNGLILSEKVRIAFGSARSARTYPGPLKRSTPPEAGREGGEQSRLLTFPFRESSRRALSQSGPDRRPAAGGGLAQPTGPHRSTRLINIKLLLTMNLTYFPALGGANK